MSLWSDLGFKLSDTFVFLYERKTKFDINVFLA